MAKPKNPDEPLKSIPDEGNFYFYLFIYPFVITFYPVLTPIIIIESLSAKWATLQQTSELKLRSREVLKYFTYLYFSLVTCLSFICKDMRHQILLSTPSHF